MKEKVFALVDGNSFFCSCERLFRPKLRNLPVIVLSNNDGCVVSRTPEAKALGIKMGVPFFQIKSLCQRHGVQVFSSNFSLYSDLSDRMMSVLGRMAVDLQVYSVDEAWLDLTGVPDLDRYARHIKETVEREVGIPVGVGLAPTKTLSKLANHLAKKSTKAQGVVNLCHPQYRTPALKRVAVDDIWGIGSRSAEKLKALNIKTAYDFAYYQNERLILKTLTKVGLQRQHELRGIRCLELEETAVDKKSIRCSRSFGSGVWDCETLLESVANYVEQAACKLREQRGLVGQLSVFFRSNSFKNTEQYFVYESALLDIPTADTGHLIALAQSLTRHFFRPGIEYKKAGVEFHRLASQDYYQLSLWTPANAHRRQQLMETMDAINRREGPMCVKSMACGTNQQAWKMLREHKSPRYTTSWHELPQLSKINDR